MKDPVQCCQLAGVQPPTSAWQQYGSETTRPQQTELQQESAEDRSKIDQTEEIIVCHFYSYFISYPTYYIFVIMYFTNSYMLVIN